MSKENKHIVYHYTDLIDLVYKNNKDIEQTRCLVNEAIEEALKLCIATKAFKAKLERDIILLEQEYKDTFNNTEIAYTDDTWSATLQNIEGKVQGLKQALNYC